jgi:hypothetical protein
MAQLVIPPPGKEAAPVRGHWDRSLHREVPEGGTDTKPMWVRNPPIPLNSVLVTSVAMFVLVFRTWHLGHPPIYPRCTCIRRRGPRCGRSSEPADGAVGDVEQPSDVHQRLPGFASRNGFLALVVRQFRLAAHYYPTSFGALSAFAAATADQFSLELGEAAAQDGQHQATMRRRGVGPGVPQRFETGALVGNGAKQIKQVTGRPRHAGQENA